jgi:hypothetical protein
METLILQVGGLGHKANKLTSIKKPSLFRRLIMDARWILLVNDQENVTGL